MTYPFKKNIINSLNEIKQNNHGHYNYKSIDFFFKNLISNEYLVIYLHGAIYIDSKTDKVIEKPIFYHWNYVYNNCDTLCLSDKLLEDFHDKNLELSWYLSTTTNYYFNIYIEILKFIFSKKYKKILFTGISGAGYASILFSSYFKCNCLIFNPQIYLDKYYYFNKFLKILEIKKNDIDIDIESFLIKKGPPNKITLVINKNDVHSFKEHAIFFELFMLKNFEKNIRTIYFKGSKTPNGKSHHRVFIPDNMNFNSILLDALLQ